MDARIKELAFSGAEIIRRSRGDHSPAAVLGWGSSSLGLFYGPDFTQDN